MWSAKAWIVGLASFACFACGGRTEGATPWHPRAAPTTADATVADDTPRSITLTIDNSVSGFPSECDYERKGVFVFYAESHTFTWSFCDWAFEGSSYVSVVNQGERLLTDEETMAVFNVYSLIREGGSSICDPDAGLITLDVETAVTTKHYAVEHYSCGPTPTNATIVTNGDRVAAWLETLVSVPSVPQDLVSLEVYGPSIFETDSTPSVNCGDFPLDHYHLYLATGIFSWTHCIAAQGSNIYDLQIGTKVLTEQQVGNVVDLASQLRAGNSAPCGVLQPESVVVLESPTQFRSFINETEACDPNAAYLYDGIYAVNVHELRMLLRSIAF